MHAASRAQGDGRRMRPTMSKSVGCATRILFLNTLRVYHITCRMSIEARNESDMQDEICYAGCGLTSGQIEKWQKFLMFCRFGTFASHWKAYIFVPRKSVCSSSKLLKFNNNKGLLNVHNTKCLILHKSSEVPLMLILGSQKRFFGLSESAYNHLYRTPKSFFRGIPFQNENLGTIL